MAALFFTVLTAFAAFAVFAAGSASAFSAEAFFAVFTAVLDAGFAGTFLELLAAPVLAVVFEVFLAAVFLTAVFFAAVFFGFFWCLGFCRNSPAACCSFEDRLRA